MILVRVTTVAAHLLWASVGFAARVLLTIGKGGKQRRILAGQALTGLLQRLGPTYVKIGQILSTRWDLLPAEITAELRVLQDAVSPLNFDAIVMGGEREFAKWAKAALLAVEDEPLACGSISCVYRGTASTGQPVAIKIRRPDIELVVAQDIACIRTAARLIAKFSLIRHIPIVAVADELCAAMEQQLDLTRELQTIRRLRRAFAGDPSVLLPEPLDALCGPTTLTMGLLDAFAHDNAQYACPDSLESAARAGLRVLYRMIFVEGLMHCDLHGGNIRLLADGRIALVDFGLVAEMSRQDQLKFAEFFYSVAAGDGRHSAAIVLQTARLVPTDLDYALFESEIAQLVDGVGRTPATFSISSFVITLFDIQRRHGVAGSSTFMTAILSLFVYEGIVRRWLPNFDFQREAQRFIFLGSFPRTAAV